MKEEIKQRLERARESRWRERHAEFLAGGMLPDRPMAPVTRAIGLEEAQTELALIQAAELRYRALERLIAGEG